MGSLFKALFDRLEKPGIESVTPGLQGEWLHHCATEASKQCDLSSHFQSILSHLYASQLCTSSMLWVEASQGPRL